MATSEAEGSAVSFIAGEAITLNRFVDISAANTVTMTDATTDDIIGVSAETVAINGTVPVLTKQGAIVKIELGATIAAGARVSTGTDGVAAAASTTGSDLTGGTLVEGGVSGDIVSMVLDIRTVNSAV